MSAAETWTPNITGDAERKMVNRLEKLYKAAAEHKGTRTGLWKKNYEFYRLKMWPDSMPAWKATPNIPMVQQKVETIVPIMTDSRPTVHMLPRDYRYTEFADTMQKLMEYEWDRMKMDEQVVLSTRNCLIKSDGFYQLDYDHDEKRPCSYVVDPENLYPDPYGTNMENLRYLVHEQMMSRDRIIRRWPKAKNKKMKVGATGREHEDPLEYKDLLPSMVDHIVGYQSDGTVTEFQEAPGADFPRTDDRIQVRQYWIRDPEMIEADLRDPMTGAPINDETGEIMKVVKPRYPGGRVIVVAGGAIIFDDKNPFWHRKFPYVKQPCYSLSNEFWSVALAECLLSLNEVSNKLLGQILDNAALMASGQWKATRQANIDVEMLTGEPGLVVEYDGGSQALVEKIPGTPLPSYVMNALDLALKLGDDASGVFDVTQGRKPVGITAGVAIEQLQEAAHTRIRLQVRNLENAIREWGEMVFAMHQQYMDGPRVIRVANEEGQFEFLMVTPEMVRAQWELMVVAGSTLPRSRDQRQREAVELHREGMLDTQGALEWIRHPAAEKVVSRLREAERRRTQAQLAGAPGPQMEPTNYMAGGDIGPPPQRRPQVSTRGGGFYNQEGA